MMRAQDIATKVANLLGGSAEVTSTLDPLEGRLRVFVPRHVPGAQRSEIHRILVKDLDPAVVVTVESSIAIDLAWVKSWVEARLNRPGGVLDVEHVFDPLDGRPTISVRLNSREDAELLHRTAVVLMQEIRALDSEGRPSPWVYILGQRNAPPSPSATARAARVWQAGDWPGGPPRAPTNKELERFACYVEEHGEPVYPHGLTRSSTTQIAPADLNTAALSTAQPSMTVHEFRRGTSYLVVAHAGSNPNPRHDRIDELREHLGTVCDQVARNGADVAGMIIAGETSIEVKATPGDLTAMNSERRRQHFMAHRAAAADVIPGLTAAHVRRIAASFRSIADALACEHCPDIVAPLSFEALGALAVLKSSWPVDPRTDEAMGLFCECLDAVAVEIKTLVLNAIAQSKAATS